MKSGSLARALAGFSWRVTALHLVTYWLAGTISYLLVTHVYYTGPQALPEMRDPSGPFVQKWILPAEILRGILLALALFPLRRALFELGRWGGAVVASLLLVIGPIAGISGIVEGIVFTKNAHFDLFIVSFPEILVQTLLFGYLLLWWDRRRGVMPGTSS